MLSCDFHLYRGLLLVKLSLLKISYPMMLFRLSDAFYMEVIGKMLITYFLIAHSPIVFGMTYAQETKWWETLDHIVKQPRKKMIQLRKRKEIRFNRSVTQWKLVPSHQHYWNKEPPPNVNQLAKWEVLERSHKVMYTLISQICSLSQQRNMSHQEENNKNNKSDTN
jgi:hypothetical protein